MNWAAIIAAIVPFIMDCIDKGADDDAIRRRLRNPGQREIRKIRTKIKRDVRREYPDLRRRERRVRVDTLVDGVLIRGRDATDEEIDQIIENSRVRRQSR